MRSFITAIFTLILSFGAWAQQNDTMFVHTQQFIHEFATAEVDSIIFYRTQERMTLPADTVFMPCDTVFITDTLVMVTVPPMDSISPPYSMFLCIMDSENFLNGELGTPYFKTDRIWTITNGAIYQEWSDVVLAPGCAKTTISGYMWAEYPTPTLTSDCRTHDNSVRPTFMQTSDFSDYFGDMFTWCAIMRFSNELCPAPWRVPTTHDFFTLDVALGGNGRGEYNTVLRDKYIATSGIPGQFWGGVYAGHVNEIGFWGNDGPSNLYSSPPFGMYWSSSEFLGGQEFGGNWGFQLARYLEFGKGDDGPVFPRGIHTSPDNATLLRCVR